MVSASSHPEMPPAAEVPVLECAIGELCLLRRKRDALLIVLIMQLLQFAL